MSEDAAAPRGRRLAAGFVAKLRDARNPSAVSIPADTLTTSSSDGGPSNRTERRCVTVGCGEAGVRSDEHAPGLYYCSTCFEVVTAIFAYVPCPALVEVQARLLLLRDRLEFVEPYPDMMPCTACSSEPETARPGTLSCSPRCAHRLRGFGWRAFPLVLIEGVRLPKKTWRLLLGVGASTYRMRRKRMGIIAALTLPLSPRHVRAGRASVIAEHALPVMAIAEEEHAVRTRIANLMPRIRTPI